MSPPSSLPALDERLQAELYLAQWHLDRGALREAYALFLKAAQSQHPVALNMLGRAYERGWGVVRDVTLARNLFEAASEGGEGWAFYNLADLYLTGDGVVRDRVQAHALYVEAARRGIGKAFNMLGLLSEEGFGSLLPSQNDARAYFEAGSACGDKAAKVNLERMRVRALL
ncbi:tetratricopeptide repeat protein [Asaia astilbis]|uniref:tetratricopeptide repeat protein n=1 Tax=Asaia astilbis TaxID=610244 RepID=UPI0009FF2BC6|nr:tetratricopeptide repeat protein [Asaia astilbis]